VNAVLRVVSAGRREIAITAFQDYPLADRDREWDGAAANGTARPPLTLNERNAMELPADVRALFEAPNYAHLATVLPDGSPHTVPLWVGIADGKIAFLTSPDSRKARNIAADPRVAISVTERGQPFTMAQVRGQVTTRLDGDEARTIIDEISRKYTGQPYPLRTDRVVFLIEAEHAHASAFG
jgi:PPOX class probable F420-dependent enzyme